MISMCAVPFGQVLVGDVEYQAVRLLRHNGLSLHHDFAQLFRPFLQHDGVRQCREAVVILVLIAQEGDAQPFLGREVHSDGKSPALIRHGAA